MSDSGVSFRIAEQSRMPAQQTPRQGRNVFRELHGARTTADNVPAPGARMISQKGGKMRGILHARLIGPLHFDRYDALAQLDHEVHLGAILGAEMVQSAFVPVL